MKQKVLLTLTVLLASLGTSALAANYPMRPVKIIVPYAAGGATDIVARLVAKGLWDELGQSFSVENRGGGSGMIGMQAAAGAAPDGYTLLVASTGPATISPLLNPSLNFNPLEQLAPIVEIASAPGILIVRNNLAAKDVSELISFSKENPSKLNMASAGSGSLQQLMGEYIQLQEGIKWTHVPFKGSAPALNEIMAERMDVMTDVVPSSAPLVKAGKIRALAVLSAHRSSQLPSVPSIDELGYKGLDFSGWHALFAPKGTPRSVIEKLNSAVNRLIKSPEFKTRLAAIGAEAEGGTPGELSSLMSDQLKKWGLVMKKVGLIKP